MGTPIRCSLASLFVAVAGAAAAPPSPGFPQDPAISPDGSLVVFTFAGDLWAVSADGGAASRLTSHPADDSAGVFSPDGKTLAFESNRDGARNLYTMPLIRSGDRVIGGEISRATISDRSQALSGFSADGKALLFSGSQEPSIYRHPRMYRAPLDGGPVTRLTDAFGRDPHMSSDGKSVLFYRGYSIWDRPKYRGPGASDVYRLNLETGEFDQLTSFDANDGHAYQTPGGAVVFVSSRDGQNNVYRLERGADDNGRANSRRLHQLTDFEPTDDQVTIGHGVQGFRVNWTGSHAVMTVWDTIYTLDLRRDDAEPVALNISISADTDLADTEIFDLDREAEEAALSPDGKTVAIIARGEVFVRSVEDDRPARRVTNTTGREQGLAWAPDNSVLYFASDEAGTWDIHRARVTLSLDDIQPKEAPKEGKEAEPEKPAEAPKQPAGDDGISGIWSCTITGPDPLPPGGAQFSLDLTRSGSSVTGTLDAGPLFTGEISGGTWSASNNTLSFSVSLADGMEVRFTLVVLDLTLFGTANAGDLSFEVEGTRTSARLVEQPAPAAAPEAQPAEAKREQEKPEEEKKEAKPKLPDEGPRWAGALRFQVEPLIATDADEMAVTPAPDGRSLLYRRDRGDLMLHDLASGDTRMVIEGWDAPDAVWVGDSRHIFYSREDLYFNSDIWLLDTADADAEPINITRHPDYDYGPRISADGKVLAFASDRDGDNFRFDIYRVYLDKSLEGLRDYELKEYFDKAAAEAKKRKVLPTIDFSAEPAEPGEPIEFDTDDAYLRIRRIAATDGSAGNVLVTPGGDRILFSGSVGGSFGYYSVDPSGGDRKTVNAGGVSDPRMSIDGTRVSFVSGGQARSASTSGGGAKAYPIDVRIEVEVAEQQRQKFLETARTMGRDFYHPTLKGLDWAGLTDRYLSLAMKTRTPGEFNRVVNMLFGELEGSHTGIWGGGGFSTSSQSVGYLGVDTTPVPGGYRVDSVLPGSPADAESTRLKVGDVILSVNGLNLADNANAMPSVNLDTAMVGTAGQQTLLEVRREDEEVDAEEQEGAEDPENDGPTYVLIDPISYGTLSNLSYEAEVLQRRQLVDEMSDGRLGYLHIRGMNMPSVRDFERDLYAAAHGKDGLIIDVRDNGGGSTTDILLSSLTAPRHAYTVPRGADPREAAPDAYPRDRRLIYQYQRPISVLINQHSFSNAEIFAHAIKTIGRGVLVGTQTFGGVISTGSFRLIDGTTVRRPFRGWYLPDGTDMENNGAMPDIDVPQTPEDEAAGRDRQLEAAVKELLDRVEDAPEGLWFPPGR
ncbi:MAG: S41 family peptidase [Phycisphaerales bacterium JB037]